VQVKLLPTPEQEQEQALAETLRTRNEAANWVSKVAFSRKCFRNYDLRRHSYREIKTTFGLSAAPAQHVIKKVADAYTTLRGSIRAGRLGRPGTKRRDKAESHPVTFDSLPALASQSTERQARGDQVRQASSRDAQWVRWPSRPRGRAQRRKASECGLGFVNMPHAAVSPAPSPGSVTSGEPAAASRG
jgi:hypothetical protein